MNEDFSDILMPSDEDYYHVEYQPPQRSFIVGLQFWKSDNGVEVWEDQYIYGGDMFDSMNTLKKATDKLFRAMDKVGEYFDEKHRKMK